MEMTVILIVVIALEIVANGLEKKQWTRDKRKNWDYTDQCYNLHLNLESYCPKRVGDEQKGKN